MKGTSVDRKIALLSGLPRPGGNFLTLTSLARLFGVSVASARVVGRRYEKKGLLRRVGPGLYANLLAKPSREQLATLLSPPSYLSFEYVLQRSGVSTQAPAELACVTRGRSRRVKTPWGSLQYHHFGPERFFGFRKEDVEGGQAWVAEPEKALLDWLYMGLLSGRRPQVDEFDLDRLDPKKLRAYARKFPPAVAALAGLA